MSKKLRITLMAEEDEELRAYIKTLIRAQVVSILRETLGDFVKEEMQKIIQGKIDKNVNAATEQALTYAGIGPKASTSERIQTVERVMRGFIASHAGREIQLAVREIAPEAVKAEVQDQIKGYVKKIME